MQRSNDLLLEALSEAHLRILTLEIDQRVRKTAVLQRGA